jgi:DNA repair exonuclease SbcCD ATPase subunit
MKTHISHIKISNILGIDSMEFDAGKFVKISGPNGSGKTSILEAIKSTLRGGHDGTLLRAGAEKGEAVIVLDDGTQIAKRVSESASTTVVTDGNGKRATKPADVVKSLADLLSVNPVDFLRASKKERVSVLLESMPIVLDPARLPKSSVSLDGHALVVLEGIRKEIYDERTGTNRAVKEKHATINQLAATLPDSAAAVPGGADGLLEKLAELERVKDAELERVATKLATMRAEKDARIEELRAKIQAEQDAFAKIEQAAAGQRERTTAKFTADSQGLRDNLTAIQEAAKAAAKHEATRGTIRTMQEQADGLQAEAEAQTKALEELEAYKSELLAALPIPGLTVVDGEIFREGVQFDRLNTQQQVQIAVDIAKLRAGKLGVICCDNLELLDSAHLDEFQKQAIESGLQIIITRVSDDAFNITNQE